MNLVFLCSLISAAAFHGNTIGRHTFLGGSLDQNRPVFGHTPSPQALENVDVVSHSKTHTEDNDFDSSQDAQDSSAPLSNDKEYIRRFWICVAIMISFLIVIYWM